MKRFFTDMNPALRGFLIIALIVVGIVTLNPLTVTFAIVWKLARIAFYIAIAFFVYKLWRDKWGDIEVWSERSKWVFHGAAVLIIVDIALILPPISFNLGGVPLLSWLLGLAILGYAMYRVWRDEHTYGD
jgi:hypothetical protein